MTRAAALVRELDAAGVAVWAEGAALRLRADRPPPPNLLADVRAHKADLLALLAVNDPTPDLAAPLAPCPTCGAGLWWRLSILSGGPGPWTCQRCAPPDPMNWIDGCAVLGMSGDVGSGIGKLEPRKRDPDLAPARDPRSWSCPSTLPETATGAHAAKVGACGAGTLRPAGAAGVAIRRFRIGRMREKCGRKANR